MHCTLYKQNTSAFILNGSDLPPVRQSSYFEDNFSWATHNGELQVPPEREHNPWNQARIRDPVLISSKMHHERAPCGHFSVCVVRQNKKCCGIPSVGIHLLHEETKTQALELPVLQLSVMELLVFWDAQTLSNIQAG
jgi:hypothetical protein